MIDSATFQPAEILKAIGVRPTPESEKILSEVFSLLLYIPVGHTIEFSAGKLNKIGEDLIQIEFNISGDLISEVLEKRKIIRIPV